MKYWLFTSIILLLLSCKEKIEPQADVKEKFSGTATLNDSELYSKKWREYLNNVNEPNLERSNITTYRYTYLGFLESTYSFRVNIDSNIATLTSKCIGYYPIEPTLDSIRNKELVKYRNKLFEITKDTIFAQTVQTLTSAQLQSFLQKVEGSYYWAITDPCPSNCTMDGDYIILETATEHCTSNLDTLSFHRVRIHAPRKGSFKDGCRYLATISQLTKNENEMLEHLAK